MRRRSTSRFGIGAGFMMALAGLMGSAQASQAYVNTPLTQGTASKDIKATPANSQRDQYRKVHTSGGAGLIAAWRVWNVTDAVRNAVWSWQR